MPGGLHRSGERGKEAVEFSRRIASFLVDGLHKARVPSTLYSVYLLAAAIFIDRLASHRTVGMAWVMVGICGRTLLFLSCRHIVKVAHLLG